MQIYVDSFLIWHKHKVQSILLILENNHLDKNSLSDLDVMRPTSVDLHHIYNENWNDKRDCFDSSAKYW